MKMSIRLEKIINHGLSDMEFQRPIFKKRKNKIESKREIYYDYVREEFHYAFYIQ